MGHVDPEEISTVSIMNHSPSNDLTGFIMEKQICMDSQASGGAGVEVYYPTQGGFILASVGDYVEGVPFKEVV